jgi:hypothetical protein
VEEEEIVSLGMAVGDVGRPRDDDEETGNIDVKGAEVLSVNEVISDIPDGLILFVISGNVVCTEDATSKVRMTQ